MRVQITVPANTPITSPTSTVVVYTEGQVISHELFDVPKGHAYLTGIQMLVGRTGQADIPEAGSNTNWLVADGRVIEKRIRIVLEPPKYQIEFRCYNLDTIYPHTFYVDLE